MKFVKTFTLLYILTLLYSCASYNYNHRMYKYSNDFLVSQENIDEIPEDWQFFIHDSSSSYQTLSKPSFNNEYLHIHEVEKSKKTVPKTLFGKPLHRKKELHILLKEKKILPNKTVKIKEEDIDKIVTIGTPKIENTNKKRGMRSNHWILIATGIGLMIGLVLLFKWFIDTYIVNMWGG